MPADRAGTDNEPVAGAERARLSSARTERPGGFSATSTERVLGIRIIFDAIRRPVAVEYTCGNGAVVIDTGAFGNVVIDTGAFGNGAVDHGARGDRS